jgi:hypothetical protein
MPTKEGDDVPTTRPGPIKIKANNPKHEATIHEAEMGSRRRSSAVVGLAEDITRDVVSDWVHPRVIDDQDEGESRASTTTSRAPLDACRRIVVVVENDFVTTRRP